MLQPRLKAFLTGNKSLFAALAISLGLFLLVLVEPLGADNAVLHSMALDMVRYGRIPYIGTWDNNFPGIVFLHAIGILLLGESGLSFRIFDVLIQLLFVVFLFKFFCRWVRPQVAALAAVLYAAYYVSGNTYLFGQQDGYGLMLIFVGVSIIIPRTNEMDVKILRIIVAGLITGLSLLMRPTFLLFIGILGLYIVFLTNRLSVFSSVSRLLLFTACAMVPMAALLFYYSTVPGGLETFYTSTIRFNLDVYTMLSGGNLWIEILRSGLMIPLAIAAITFKSQDNSQIFQNEPRKKEISLLVAMLAAGLFIVIYMGKYWRYQFAPFYMALIPFSAVGIERAMLQVREGLLRHFVMVGCVISSTFIMYNPIAPLAFALGLIQHSNPFLMAEEARRPSPLSGAKPEHALIAYMEKPENRSGDIEYCGFDPFIRLDLPRRFIGRYTTFHALAFRTDATNVGTPHYTDYQRKWQADYVVQIEQAKPRFIILGRGMPFWYIRDIYSDCLRYLPGFDDFFKSNYRYDTAFGGFQVYQYTK